MSFFPVNVTLEVTNHCNLSCKQCFRFSSSKMNDELSLEEIEDVLDQLLVLGTVHIEMSGGEPMMRPDILEILHAAISREFETTLITNGTMLDEKRCADLRNTGLKMAQVSIDGDEKFHNHLRGNGNFQSTIQGVVNLVKNDMRVTINMVVTSGNYESIPAVAKLAYSLGAKGFALSPFLPAGRGIRYCKELTLSSSEMRSVHGILTDLIKVYDTKMTIYSNPIGYLDSPVYCDFNRKRIRQCSCGRHLLFIKPNGVLSPCDFDLFSAGNLRELKIADAWNNAAIFKTFREFDPKNLKGACAVCGVKDPCGGGCRALAVIHSGDFYGENPICPKVTSGCEEAAF